MLKTRINTNNAIRLFLCGMLFLFSINFCGTVVFAQEAFVDKVDLYMNPTRLFDPLVIAIEKTIPHLDVSGFIISEIGKNLHPNKTDFDFNRIMWRYELDLDYVPQANFRTRLKIHYLYDALYDWTGDGRSVPSSSARDTMRRYHFLKEILREAYFDWTKGDFWLRVGKQIVTWGKVPGRRVTDFVNPQDDRYFLDTSQDYDNLKIPLFMLNLKYEAFPYFVEFLAIPQFEPNFEAAAGTPWAWRPIPGPRPPFRVVIKDPKEPDDWDDEWQFAARAGFLLNGWDFNALYLHTWNFIPTFFRESFAGGTLTLAPRHVSVNKFGFNLEKSWDLLGRQWGFKIEGVFTPSQRLSDTSESIIEDGIVKRDHLLWDFAVETTVFHDVSVSLTLVGEHVFGGSTSNLTIFPTRHRLDENAWSPTFFCRKAFKFTDDNLVFTGLLIWNESENWDGRATFSYFLADRTTIDLQYHGLNGDRTYIWGNFRDADEIILRIKWMY